MAGNVNLIIGAGAVGTVLMCYLQRAGQPVRILLRDKDLPAYQGLRELRMERVGGTTLVTAAPALTTQLSLDDVENIFICVKHPALAGVVASLPKPLPGNVRLITCLNGVGIADRLRREIPGAKVATLTVMYNAQLLGPLHAQLTTKPQVFLACDDEAPYGLFRGSGMDLRRSQGDAAAWGKLLINLNNAVCALTHKTFKDLLSDKDMIASFVMVLDESVAMLEKLRIAYTLPLPISYPTYRRLLRYGGPLPWWFARFKNGVTEASYPSMVADVERGRPTEIEQLNGEILRLGAKAGCATPVNAKIVALVQAMQGKVPEQYLTPSQLRAALVASTH